MAFFKMTVKTTVKAVLMTTVLSLASVSQAELISNVPLDYSRFDLMGAEQLVQLANQNNQHAQFYLAKRLQKGQGFTPDPAKAVHWYTRAANQGVIPAQLNLGKMYAMGQGVPVNEQQARYWLEKATMHGDNRASYLLAMIEEKQQKLVDAYKWYDLSARDGMLDERVRNKARGKIGQLALNLSSKDITNARNQATSWLQNK